MTSKEALALLGVQQEEFDTFLGTSQSAIGEGCRLGRQ